MRAVSVQQRRRALVRRHHLGGDAVGPEAVTRDLVALHATDPASVYLSVLARTAAATLADVADAMYQRRTLVRWMAMRRTLFVFDRTEIPVVQAAVSTPLAEVLQRRLLSQLRRNGTQPPIETPLEGWLTELQARVEAALDRLGTATGAQLSAAEPALRTQIQPRAASDRPATVTSPLLTILSAQGRMVRSTPTGAWTIRGHRWEPVRSWWPDGLPELSTVDAQRELARRWLARFGPATLADLQWWAGWTKGTVTRAVAALPVEEVDLHGQPGLVLSTEDDGPDDREVEPVAALLPALDPTPMGWKQRDWLFGCDPAQLFDRSGNIGPTLWWDGEIVGSWTVAGDGEVRTALVVDRGAAAGTAVEAAAARLHDRLGGAAVTPVFPTALERSLR